MNVMPPHLDSYMLSNSRNATGDVFGWCTGNNIGILEE
jgi:hypothetical protein